MWGNSARGACEGASGHGDMGARSMLNSKGAALGDRIVSSEHKGWDVRPARPRITGLVIPTYDRCKHSGFPLSNGLGVAGDWVGKRVTFGVAGAGLVPTIR